MWKRSTGNVRFYNNNGLIDSRNKVITMRRRVIVIFLLLSFSMISINGCGRNPEKKVPPTEAEDNSVKDSKSPEKEESKAIEVEREEQKETQSLTYDFSTDVENGLLYSTEDGRVSDKDGNVIAEYDYITVLNNGSLSDESGIYDGYMAGAGGKIVLSIPDEVDYSNSGMKEPPATYEAQICRDIIPIYEGADTSVMEGRQFADDGNYFDEVVSGAWFDENGNPIALSFPKKLKLAFFDRGWLGPGPKQYIPIDQIYTIDRVRREMPVFNDDYLDDYCVSLLVKNIEKHTGENGEIYYSGFEYWSNEQVVIHGNFTGILNHDDLLVFGVFKGLGADDTPNFEAVLISVENGRF